MNKRYKLNSKLGNEFKRNNTINSTVKYDLTL